MWVCVCVEFVVCGCVCLDFVGCGCMYVRIL